MTAESNQPHLISLEEAACRRLAHVEKIALPMSGATVQAVIASPVSYMKNRKKAYPLLLALDARHSIGSLIEMSRLMVETKEISECIVVGLSCEIHDHSDFPKLTDWLQQEVIPWCKSNYRVAANEIAVFGAGKLGAFALHLMLAGSGEASAFIVSEPDAVLGSEVLSRFRKNGKLSAKATPRLALTTRGASSPEFQSALQGALVSVADISGQKLVDIPENDLGLPAFVHGLRSLWRTGTEYGKGVTSMRAAWIPVVLGAFAPIMRKLQSGPRAGANAGNPYLIRSSVMDRDFEAFVSLPRSFVAGSGRRYPVVFALDANIEFSTVAETAATLAAEHRIEEVIVVGVGVPRAEGPLAFAFRRFEEFSPPADGYDYRDDLGRIFRSLFAIRGQDARKQLGRAPQFFKFMVNELLPMLAARLPIDQDNMGILGHSAGGTFVLFALCQAHSPFRHYAGISPGLAVSGSWLLNRHDADFRISQNSRSVFLSLGSEEKGNLFNQYAGIDQTQEFAERLRQSTDLSVQSMCFENETHSSTYPRAVINALLTAFPASNQTVSQRN